MNTLLISLLLMSAGPEKAGEHTDDVGFSEEVVDALLTEPKSEIVEGKSLTEREQYDEARLRFRKNLKTDTDRAVAEYNVGRTLTLEADALAKKGTDLKGDDEAAKAEIQKRYQMAADTFDRAYSMSKNKKLQSQSALAAGNARLSQGDLKGAIENYRQSMVSDPEQTKARENLSRALRAMRAQPPPPPQQDDENKEEQEGDEQQEGEQQEGDEKQEGEEKQEGDQKEDEQKPGDQKEEQKSGDQKDEADKKEDEQKPGDKKEDEQKPGDKKDEQKPGDKKDEGKEGQKGQGKNGQPDEKQSKKDARDMLDALRAKERPINPLLMRDQEPRKRPRSGKDW